MPMRLAAVLAAAIATDRKDIWSPVRTMTRAGRLRSAPTGGLATARSRPPKGRARIMAVCFATDRQRKKGYGEIFSRLNGSRGQATRGRLDQVATRYCR